MQRGGQRACTCLQFDTTRGYQWVGASLRPAGTIHVTVGKFFIQCRDVMVSQMNSCSGELALTHHRGDCQMREEGILAGLHGKRSAELTTPCSARRTWLPTAHALAASLSRTQVLRPSALAVHSPRQSSRMWQGRPS